MPSTPLTAPAMTANNLPPYEGGPLHNPGRAAMTDHAKPIARFQLSARLLAHLQQRIEASETGQANAGDVLVYIRAVFLTVGTELPNEFAYDLDNDWLNIYDYPASDHTNKPAGQPEAITLTPFEQEAYNWAETRCGHPDQLAATISRLRSALAAATRERDEARERVAELEDEQAEAQLALLDAGGITYGRAPLVENVRQLIDLTRALLENQTPSATPTPKEA